ncbi:MAG: Maf family protein, partial [Balneolaceae bacterium]
MKIILASASPRRKKLLNQINLSFTVDPSDVDEHIDTDESPDIISENLAFQKGKDVAARHPDSFIISADTIVCFNGQILGKPASKEEAVNMLMLLSSNSHDVYTGVNLGITDHRGVFSEQVTFHEKTKVTFAALELQEI